ncbi:MAG: NAD(P)H-hydrate dehydratase [Butyribacter sp.]|nr:NAD(P)H-hydrate dehydratase [bacterium]MDY3855210.1 NAD(P)H-hydrate dehydratase [Butyribacter sp.]
MQYIADAQKAKKIDMISIQDVGIPSCVLMERASLKIADCICENIKSVSKKVFVISGTGNNGGDGIAAGRILAERGYQVTFCLIGDEKKASEEMKLQLAIIRKLGFLVATDFSENAVLPDRDSIIIDALFGIGLSREVTGRYAECINWMNQMESTIVSVDIPSGIDASTANVLGVAVKADYTVTFGVNKLGLVLFPGMQYAGKVLVEDIGFPKDVIKREASGICSYEMCDIVEKFPKRIIQSNKGSYGKVLVIAGSEYISGAAFFSAKAAYLMGCGLVHVVSHRNNREMLQTKLPEALFTFYQENDMQKENVSLFLEQLQESMKQASAIVIGPGIGQSDFSKKMLECVLEHSEVPTVIDADGINLLAGMREYFDEDGRIKLAEHFVLTPHLKEMSRLRQSSVGLIQENLVQCAKESTTGSVIVLKDARTVISDGSQMVLNQSGNNALAKGGSGDVLSGMTGGLLARGVRPFDAAALSVYLHGVTAEKFIRDNSSSSMLASDILEMLPKVLP